MGGSAFVLYSDTMKIFSRSAAIRLLILFLLLGVLSVYGWIVMIRMPGESFRGELAPWSEEEVTMAQALRRHVSHLATEIGERNVDNPEEYHRAADYIEDEFAAAGFEVRRQAYEARGVRCYNLEVELQGKTRSDEIIVIGAHYDTVDNSPGANDNTSGIAGTLALARLLRESKPDRTVRFVAFANEEWPYFKTNDMGSMRYARAAQERGENIIGMISLETIGYFSDEPSSQRYPFPFNLFYPSEGNFIAFITNYKSRSFVRDVIREFRRTTEFPSEGAAIPEQVPGVGWSDHWAFWQAGFPALMVTDTAPYRYPHYHTSSDTEDKLDYQRMARIILGMERVLLELANPK